MLVDETNTRLWDVSSFFWTWMVLKQSPEADTKIQRMQGKQSEMEDALKTLQGEIKDSRMIKWICCSGWYSVSLQNVFAMDDYLTYSPDVDIL